MYKICVYAICKNEIKFADRWLSSLSAESDYIVVLDTGSTDGTYEFLKQDPRVYCVEQKIINPWRFDDARNASMKLIPKDTDICVIADFDHIFRPGWGDELRRLFSMGYKEIYGDIIDYDDDNIEIKRFLSKNVHPNSPEWYWERPIHEGVNYHGSEDIMTITSDNFIIEHHPDYTKSRGSYLGLLEMEYKENHADPMCAIYYGCELCFHNREEEGFRVFLKANEECDYANVPEIGYQMQLNIADSYRIRGQYDKALSYAIEAEKFGVITRNLYMRRADIYFEMQDYQNAIEMMQKALTITENIKGWQENQEYFNGKVYDQLSLVYDKIGDNILAIANCSMALLYHPDDERLQSNMRYFVNKEMNA